MSTCEPVTEVVSLDQVIISVPIGRSERPGLARATERLWAGDPRMAEGRDYFSDVFAIDNDDCGRTCLV